MYCLLASGSASVAARSMNHLLSRPMMKITFPSCRVRGSIRLVDTGSVVGRARISSSTEAASHLVARLLGVETARRAARQMEYQWSESRSS